jgi:DsbC/DsbD-like thiol-disulfide interchange protein
MLRRLVPFIVALLAAAVASAATDPTRYMPAELIAGTLDPAPGRTILVGIRMTPRPGWHGYWSNPGDSGIATTVRWSAPGGESFGPLLHPAPSLLSAGGVDSYVHEGEHILLSRMSVPASLARGTTIPIVADLSWAACTAAQCVPLRAKLRLDLTTGDGSKSTEWTALNRAAAKLPKASPPGTFVRDRGSVQLLLPPNLGLNARATRFFADQPEAFDTGSGHAEQSAGRLAIRGAGNPAPRQPISGVVTDGRAAYRLVLRQFREPLAVAQPEPRHREIAKGQTRDEPQPEVRPASSSQYGSRNAKAEEPGRRTPWLPLGAVALLATCVAIVARRRSPG